MFCKYFLYSEDSKKCLKLTKSVFFIPFSGCNVGNFSKNPFKWCIYSIGYMYFFNKMFFNTNEVVKISMVRLPNETFTSNVIFDE